MYVIKTLATVFTLVFSPCFASAAVEMNNADKKSITAWKKCVEKAHVKYGINLATLNIPGIVDAIEDKADCNKLLTSAARAKLYEENKSWYEFFEAFGGGPLDPTLPGYFDRI